MTTHMPLSDSQLEHLAPQHLHSQRKTRYHGDGYSVPLATFSERDQGIIRDIYATLLDLFDFLKEHKNEPLNVELITAWIQKHDWRSHITSLHQLGTESRDENNSELVRQVIHDVRGGSLAALSMTLQLAPMGLSQYNDFIHMFFLARDHLKIMRNAIPDVDLERATRDQSEKEHSIDLLVEKWQDTTYTLSEHQTKVVLDCDFEGTISERCMEFSALDRVVYNLINNASRFAANNQVYFSIFGIEKEQDTENVRFVVYNKISDEHYQVLTDRFGEDINGVFGTDFTTGGTGMGMAIGAGFVSSAYGLNSIEKTLENGYCGATVIDKHFVSWFHWPVVAD